MAKETEQGPFLPLGGTSTTETSFDNKPSLFSLNPGIYLATGVKNGAIYDTNTGKIYSLNAKGVQAIRTRDGDCAFQEKLARELRIKAISEPTPLIKEKTEIKLDFVWFEILSDDCNECCVHCYADSMPKSYRRNLEVQTPVISPKDQKKLSAYEWKKLIDESFVLGARQCQFIGGEPFLWRGENKETVLDLAEHAKETGFETVEIFTNGTLITEAVAQRIKDIGLGIAISLYSIDETTHESITRTRGSFKKTISALQMLKTLGIPARVETVLMKQNQKTIEDTDKAIAEMGFEHRTPDVIRPNGRGGNHDLYPDKDIAIKYSIKMRPDFPANSDYIRRNMDAHSCLAGKITITDTGEVLPCIFSREQITGNVRTSGSLKNILEGEMQNIWRITKDDVLVCQDCEYRYVCADCRPLAQAASGNKGDYKSSPYPRCAYNPYEGEWGKGIWKLDHDAKPLFDTSSIKQIQEEHSVKGGEI